MSKGSRPRPFSVTQQEYDARWDAIFAKDLTENPPVSTMPQPKNGTCGCGRSPTGDCIGWHSLTETAFREKLSEYNARLSHS
jgi:hypothetical protein